MGPTGWAILSAFFGGLGLVLQQRGALEAPSADTDRAGFVRAIVREPIWLAGGACQAGCWACQGVALSKGPLSLVQPICSLQIVLALPLGIAITHQRVGRRDWLGAVFVVAGLAIFLGVSNPSAGRESAPAAVWIGATAVVAALAAAAAVLGARSGPAVKAALYGAAGGVVFGLQAAVMKEWTVVVSHGLHAVLTDWSTYALILTSLAGFYLIQTALQVGTLAPAVASSNAASPIAGVVLGRVLFLETPSRTAAGDAVAVAALGVMLLGLVWLSRGQATRPRDG